MAVLIRNIIHLQPCSDSLALHYLYCGLLLHDFSSSVFFFFAKSFGGEAHQVNLMVTALL